MIQTRLGAGCTAGEELKIIITTNLERGILAFDSIIETSDIEYHEVLSSPGGLRKTF